MYVHAWDSIIEAAPSGNFPIRIPQYVLIAKLACAACNEITTVRSEEIRLGEVNGYYTGIPTEWFWSKSVDDISKLRECPKCGSLSTIPEDAKRDLKRQVKNFVTADWLQNEKKKYQIGTFA